MIIMLKINLCNYIASLDIFQVKIIFSANNLKNTNTTLARRIKYRKA